MQRFTITLDVEIQSPYYTPEEAAEFITTLLHRADNPLLVVKASCVENPVLSDEEISVPSNSVAA